MSPNEQLHAIVAKLAPAAAAVYQDSGEWPAGTCPYVIETLGDGRRRVRVTDPVSGDSIGAVGPTTWAAITALAEKLGLAKPKEETPA